MTLLLDVRAAAIAAIKEACPALSEVTTYPGWLGRSELDALLSTTPSVRVAILGTRRIKRDGAGYVDVPVRFAAFVLTYDSDLSSDDSTAAEITTTLLPVIDRNDWGLANVGPAKLTKVRNLYRSELNGKGIALWCVLWRQTIRLGSVDSDVIGWTGGTLTQVFVGMSPQTGSGHADDYSEIQGDDDV